VEVVREQRVQVGRAGREPARMSRGDQDRHREEARG
jgi:hypothetical protein